MIRPCCSISCLFQYHVFHFQGCLLNIYSVSTHGCFFEPVIRFLGWSVQTEYWYIALKIQTWGVSSNYWLHFRNIIVHTNIHCKINKLVCFHSMKKNDFSSFCLGVGKTVSFVVRTLIITKSVTKYNRTILVFGT